MDNLAHTLAGAALGEAGLKRRTPLAFPTLLIAANLPDLDVLAIPFGASLTFRRGWTHGILAMIVLPLLLAAAMLLWDRFVRRRRDAQAVPAIPSQLVLLSVIGVLSHPFLDWLNVYGIRLLMPFDGRWFYGDTLFIVDPWLWVILLAGVILGRRAITGGWGRRSVTLASVYILLMLILGQTAPPMVEGGLRREGLTIDEVMVAPMPVNPVSREVVIRQGDRYLTGRLSWLPRPRLVIDDQIVRQNADHPVAMQVSNDPRVRDFLSWSRFPFFSVERWGTGYRVVLDDLRYTDGTRPSFAAVELFINTGRGRGELTREMAPGATPSAVLTGNRGDLPAVELFSRIRTQLVPDVPCSRCSDIS